MSYSIKYADKTFKHRNDFMMFLKENIKTFDKLKKNEYKNNSNKFIESVVNKASFSHYKPNIDVNSDHIEVKAVINTTNLIDSHLDLHLPSIWKKNLKEHPTKLQLQEHQMKFSNLLDDEAKSKVEKLNFKDLGLDIDMETEALIHTFNFKRSDNKEMFKYYVEGKVKEHSVGMNYVKISFAYDDPDDEKEKNYFEENKAKSANPEVAEERGYFWVVTEAKDREGSAVVKGSNYVTPTLYVKDYEPSKDTRTKGKPSIDTSNIIQSMFNF